jgi:hypothetical protein
MALYNGLGAIMKPLLNEETTFAANFCGAAEWATPGTASCQFAYRVEGLYVGVFGEADPEEAVPPIPLPSSVVDDFVISHYRSCTPLDWVNVFGPVCVLIGLTLIAWGGRLNAGTRFLLGASFGAVFGYHTNLLHTVLCFTADRASAVPLCAAVDDPFASAVLAGFLLAQVCLKSTKVAFVILVSLCVAVIVSMIGLTLPIEGSFHRTVRDPVLATTAMAAVALGGLLGCSPAFKAYVVGCSRAVLVVLTSLLGAGALVVTWLEIPDGEHDTTYEDRVAGAIVGWSLFAVIFVAAVVFQQFSAPTESADGKAYAFREQEFNKAGKLPNVPGDFRATALNRSHKAAPMSSMADEDAADGDVTAPGFTIQITPPSGGDSGNDRAYGEAASQDVRLRLAANSKEDTPTMSPPLSPADPSSNSATGSLGSGSRVPSLPDLRDLQDEEKEELRRERVKSIDIVGADQSETWEGEEQVMQGLSFSLLGSKQREVSAGDTFFQEGRDGALVEHEETMAARIYLWTSLLLTVLVTAAVPFMINWPISNMPVALLYCLVNWFLLWNVVDVFISSVAYHFVRIVYGFVELPRRDLVQGLPDSARTLIQFCLLSADVETSQATFENAYDCFMQNLDPNGNLACAVVSVSNKASIVTAEVETCHALQQRFLRETQAELDEFLELATDLPWPILVQEQCPAEQRALARNKGVIIRWYFYSGLAARVHREKDASFSTAREPMRAILIELSKDILYLHRNCRVLKKPGQYQDGAILAYTGNNSAYTYTDDRYGKLGRKAGTHCFGYTGNLVNDTEEDMSLVIQKLQKTGQRHVRRLERLGGSLPYRYSLVMDSDTASGWRSVLRLIEYAVENPEYGIFQSALSVDETLPGQTWYMWAELLRGASSLNLPKANFAIFRRHGFYGKGLIDNVLMIRSVIGRMPEKANPDGSYYAVEALPPDIMSHDTFEAKILRPCFISAVRFREEPAKNGLSFFPQTTRWMTGEVRNNSYPSGIFRAGIIFAQRLYALVHGDGPRPPFQRQEKVPVTWSSDYLAHVSFRIMHAGPAVMMLVLLRTYMPALGFIEFRNKALGLYLTMFTATALFVIPKGLLILDMIPSLELRKKEERPGVLYTPAVDSPVPPPPKEKVNGCTLFLRMIYLAAIELILSALIFGPECLLGLQRMFLAYFAQISGKVVWRPQAQVDREIEEHTMGVSVFTRFRYVLTQTWHVPVVGLGIAASTTAIGVIDPLSIVLWASWVMHPIIVTWGCSPCPSDEKSFLVRHVKQTMSMREGGTACRKVEDLVDIQDGRGVLPRTIGV